MTTQVAERYRLVTRSDFDGLVCAALLKELGILDDILFVHPKDMQDGKVELTDRDITTNLPYVPGVHLSFDHHDSEIVRVEDSPENHVIVAGAKSAARVVYDYFGGAETFKLVGEDIMSAVDKADAADFTREDILEPQGWDYISFLMDPRTGLGRFREFRISNYQLMMQLIDDITTKSIEEILETPDVAERVELYRDTPTPRSTSSAAVPRSTATWSSSTSATRTRSTRPTASRSTRCSPSATSRSTCSGACKQQNTVFAVGKSILDRSSQTDVGELMLPYGGGGHSAAGTCQVANEDAERVQAELLRTINADG